MTSGLTTTTSLPGSLVESIEFDVWRVLIRSLRAARRGSVGDETTSYSPGSYIAQTGTLDHVRTDGARRDDGPLHAGLRCGDMPPLVQPHAPCWKGGHPLYDSGRPRCAGVSGQPACAWARGDPGAEAALHEIRFGVYDNVRGTLPPGPQRVHPQLVEERRRAQAVSLGVVPIEAAAPLSDEP